MIILTLSHSNDVQIKTGMDSKNKVLITGAIYFLYLICGKFTVYHISYII